MRTQKTGEDWVDQPLGEGELEIPYWAEKGILETGHLTLSVQTRISTWLPEWIGDAMKQAETPVSSDKLPVVVLHEHRARYEDALVVMRLKDVGGGSTKVHKAKVGQRNESAPKPVVQIWTYGDCREGKGAWAAVIYGGSSPRREIRNYMRRTTKDRQKLWAAIEALYILEEPSRVQLFSDSAELAEGFEKGWVFDWKRNGWRKADNERVKNVDLWYELLEHLRYHDVEVVKLDGHSGASANQRVQTLVWRLIDLYTGERV